MNAVKLAKIFGEMGCLFYQHELKSALDYFQKMLEADRIVYILSDDKPYAFLFISLTNDPDAFLKKGKWEYLDQDEAGKILYVEKLISKGWDKETRVLFEKLITEKYPQIEYGLWHRWAKWGDRKVTSKRRIPCMK